MKRIDIKFASALVVTQMVLSPVAFAERGQGRGDQNHNGGTNRPSPGTPPPTVTPPAPAPRPVTPPPVVVPSAPAPRAVTPPANNGGFNRGNGDGQASPRPDMGRRDGGHREEPRRFEPRREEFRREEPRRFEPRREEFRREEPRRFEPRREEFRREEPRRFEPRREEFRREEPRHVEPRRDWDRGGWNSGRRNENRGFFPGFPRREEHSRHWGDHRNGDWQRRFGNNPRWSGHAGRWDNHFGRWNQNWELRRRIYSERRLFSIDSLMWMNYWRSHYRSEYFFYPPYGYENGMYFVGSEPDFNSQPEPHYMEADVTDFLNLRSSPYVSNGNICGQLPAGAIVPVVSIVRTTEDGQGWAMIQVDEDIREFMNSSECAGVDYVFANMEYLK